MTTAFAGGHLPTRPIEGGTSRANSHVNVFVVADATSAMMISSVAGLTTGCVLPFDASRHFAVNQHAFQQPE